MISRTVEDGINKSKEQKRRPSTSKRQKASKKQSKIVETLYHILGSLGTIVGIGSLSNEKSALLFYHRTLSQVLPTMFLHIYAEHHLSINLRVFCCIAFL